MILQFAKNLSHEPLARLLTNQFINTMILSVCCVAMHAMLFVQYDFWCSGTLQEKQDSIFSHNQKVISLIQGDETTKPGDEMTWGPSDSKALKDPLQESLPAG